MPREAFLDDPVAVYSLDPVGTAVTIRRLVRIVPGRVATEARLNIFVDLILLLLSSAFSNL